MSTRVDVVADELKARLERMKARPQQGSVESPYEKARREALVTAEAEELRLLLRAILSGAERRQGAIPFARDADGQPYAPDPADESVLEGLGLVPGRPATRGDAGDWVVAERPDPETGIVIAVARPIGPALTRDPRDRGAQPHARPGPGVVALLGHPAAVAAHDAPPRLADRRAPKRSQPGDLDVQVPVPHGREFRRLAETFNRMARDLRRNQERLIEQERLRKELEIGRRIQEELLAARAVSLPLRRDRRRLDPRARGGRRFLQLLPALRRRAAVLVGDVSGKGVPAALLMASVQATLRARLSLERDLARLVDAPRPRDGQRGAARVRTTRCSSGILDGRSGRLRYVNAGHNTQFLLRRDGAEGLASTGRPLGALPGGGFEERVAQLAPGDALFLFTDGLVEAEDESGEPFGMSRLEALLKLNRGHELKQQLGEVDAAVRSHRGPHEAADDATMVMMRYSNGEAAGRA